MFWGYTPWASPVLRCKRLSALDCLQFLIFFCSAWGCTTFLSMPSTCCASDAVGRFSDTCTVCCGVDSGVEGLYPKTRVWCWWCLSALICLGFLMFFIILLYMQFFFIHMSVILIHVICVYWSSEWQLSIHLSYRPSVFGGNNFYIGLH